MKKCHTPWKFSAKHAREKIVMYWRPVSFSYANVMHNKTPFSWCYIMLHHFDAFIVYREIITLSLAQFSQERQPIPCLRRKPEFSWGWTRSHHCRSFPADIVYAKAILVFVKWLSSFFPHWPTASFTLTTSGDVLGRVLIFRQAFRLGDEVTVVFDGSSSIRPVLQVRKRRWLLGTLPTLCLLVCLAVGHSLSDVQGDRGRGTAPAKCCQQPTLAQYDSSPADWVLQSFPTHPLLPPHHSLSNTNILWLQQWVQETTGKCLWVCTRRKYSRTFCPRKFAL